MSRSPTQSSAIELAAVDKTQHIFYNHTPLLFGFNPIAMPLTAAQQKRLQEDLRGLIKGDVRCDGVTQQLYATDASILQARPVCIVCPRNIDDVAAAVKYAAEEKIPLHARGAGTSLTGESLGEGIILVFSRYMRRILHTGYDSVTVQPGMLRRRLNGIIRQSQSRQFGPLAGNVSSASLGSILARNGAGMHYLRYGLPSDHLIALTVVLADGEVLKLDRNALHQPMEIQPVRENDTVTLAQEIAYGKEYIYAGKIAHILNSRTAGQLAESARQLPVNRAGYTNHDVLKGTILQGQSDGCVDLARLFAGSEGTLGITVEATLKTVSLPLRKSGAVLFFKSIFSALEAIPDILTLRPVLCELVDRRRLTMLRDGDTRYRPFIPDNAEAALLVELDAGTVDEPIRNEDCRNNVQHLIDLIQTKKQLCFQSFRVHTEPDFQLFDQLVRRSELVLHRMNSSIQPVPLFDDVAVPIDAMQDTVSDFLSLLQQHKVIASFSGHAGQGHIRIHPLLDLSQPELKPMLRHLAEDVYAAVLNHGGTISSEWGTGLLKPQCLPMQFPLSMPVFQKIKETFDPKYQLNPGKVISAKSSHWTSRLRHGLENRGQPPPVKTLDDSQSGFAVLPKNLAKNRPPNQVELQLKWEPARIFEPAYQCNGCGECFRYDRQSRICPLFRGTATIEYAPRSKADLLRGVLEGDIELEMLTSDKAKEIADTCFHCRMCDIECPANVDVSLLAFRSKAAHVAAHGLPLDDLLASRLDNILDWAMPSNFLFNAAMRSRVVRWLIEKVLHVPQRRKIPPLTHRSYLNRVRWTPLRHRFRADQTQKTRVALFVDTYANYFDPQLAELAVQILKHNGFSVHIPPRQRPAGRASLAVGHINRAERLARQNTIQLAELVRQGYKIVTIEPHSASCLSKDYQHLIGGEDSELLAKNVVDFCSLLWQQHRSGKLHRDFQPMLYRVGYHAPCSALAISASLTTDLMPVERLLRLIPGLGVQRIERGCCGMSGLWGFQQKNYRHSLKIGIPLFRALRPPEIDFGVSDCTSCCLQMSHGSRKRAVHPIRLLAAAYGFIGIGR